MSGSRRDFLKQGLALSAGLLLPGCSLLRYTLRDPDLPLEEVPDLSDANVLRHVAGVRPFRKKKPRIELTESGDRVLVHCYGHGGAGITMGWGSGEVAAEMARSRAVPREPVAVLGAGVVGLSTARVLQLMGHPVRVYAAAFHPNTTSNVAGGEWSPAVVALGDNTTEQAFFEDILVRSYRHYESLIGTRYGVSRRLNYCASFDNTSLDRVPRGLLPPVQFVNRLPFPGVPHEGKIFRTLMIEPPIYLPALMNDLRDGGAAFVARRFATEDEIRQLPERIAVNCMGLGAGEVCRDELVVPIRGQLVHLRPKRHSYMLIHDGYIFPREDAIVVGGSLEKGKTDTTPDPVIAQRILETSRRYFWGA